VEKQVEAGEERGVGEYRLPEDLSDEERLGRAIGEALESLDEAERDHLHPTDPEARMMVCDGKKAFAFNAQAVVDAASGLIVAERVVNDEEDSRCLTPMIAEVEEVMGQAAEQTVADGGRQT